MYAKHLDVLQHEMQTRERGLGYLQVSNNRKNHRTSEDLIYMWDLGLQNIYCEYFDRYCKMIYD